MDSKRYKIEREKSYDDYLEDHHRDVEDSEDQISDIIQTINHKNSFKPLGELGEGGSERGMSIGGDNLQDDLLSKPPNASVYGSFIEASSIAHSEISNDTIQPPKGEMNKITPLQLSSIQIAAPKISMMNENQNDEKELNGNEEALRPSNSQNSKGSFQNHEVPLIKSVKNTTRTHKVNISKSVSKFAPSEKSNHSPSSQSDKKSSEDIEKQRENLPIKVKDLTEKNESENHDQNIKQNSIDKNEDN